MRRLIEPNYTKDDSADPKKYFLKCYLAMIIASLISNGIVVASIPWRNADLVTKSVYQ
ncbi:MAG: hypothetical protein O9264_06335 [Leptospira sp.]|nr:hypothetical protein [Leptospira sp.]